MTIYDFTIESDLESLTASDQVDQKKTECTCFKTNKKKPWQREKSVAEELLNAFKQPKLCPMPTYISEADTVSVDDFMQSQVCL